MASPPHNYSPAGSPPYPSNAQLPSKKRGSAAAELAVQPPSLKRRKASTMSVTSTSSGHPLRQTSFPPDESQPQAAFSPSYRGRSPSVDTMSLVSGSQVSAAPVKKKRGRKSKAERANEAAAEAAMRDATPSLVGGRAPTELSTASGNRAGKGGDDADEGREGEGEFELPENMASKAAHRSKEQIKEEERLRALVSRHMDRRQFVRYEVWHGATLRMADVKRHINSVTSQSCPVNVQQMMQVVCKMYLGDVVEEARRIQQEWINNGEKQVPEGYEEDEKELGELSKHRRQAPLRPDHLREAYRRRKVAAENGGAMGSLLHWNSQTQNGLERFAARAGGRRIFK
ncbi:hypothetical protein DL762_010389 [Monosporascus cannonballus]|uniref:TAFII28-like protein domain-containing protein n=1 Tax=Monosporascus cannonballus TaxID=155416 RepID=A0ABY0GUM4_9PEZI|nr:hypothetical protein DL762_010389 [Monosporascus cannonballus]RYO99525.1 hypothetical protein DL763_001436 [Monosporascus cannonballus]